MLRVLGLAHDRSLRPPIEAGLNTEHVARDCGERDRPVCGDRHVQGGIVGDLKLIILNNLRTVRVLSGVTCAKVRGDIGALVKVASGWPHVQSSNALYVLRSKLQRHTTIFENVRHVSVDIATQ